MWGYLPATQQTQKRRRSYWTVKNLLARTPLRLPGVLEQHSSPFEPSSNSQSSSSSDTREDPDPPKHKDLQQSGEQPSMQGNQGDKMGKSPPMKQGQCSEQRSLSSFIKRSGLPLKEDHTSSPSDSSYGCPTEEETPPGGPLVAPSKLN
jgi:hypothetical protein